MGRKSPETIQISMDITFGLAGLEPGWLLYICMPIYRHPPRLKILQFRLYIYMPRSSSSIVQSLGVQKATWCERLPSEWMALGSSFYPRPGVYAQVTSNLTYPFEDPATSEVVVTN